MTERLDRLPLHDRRRDEDEAPRVRLKLTAVAVVSHVGLCIAVLFVWVFAALFLRPPLDRMVAYQKGNALIGVVAMVLLFGLCIATMARLPWARAGMLAWAACVLPWRIVVLLTDLFVYSQVYQRRADEIIRDAAAAATNPATQPSRFEGFVSYGLYVIPIIGFLIFGGYAYAVWRAMRSPSAADSFRSRARG